MKKDQGKNGNGVAILIKHVPKNVHHRFKAWAAKHGLTMQEAFISLVKGTK